MTYTPEQLRELVEEVRRGEPIGITRAVEIVQGYADALEEIGRLKKENDTLRGLLGNSAKPCPYCGLAAEDQAKCASGFPGCARADDQQLSSHFADAYRAERAEAALAESERKCERLKFHAEAMARDLDDWSIYAGCPSNVAKAYRDEFKEE